MDFVGTDDKILNRLKNPRNTRSSNRLRISRSLSSSVCIRFTRFFSDALESGEITGWTSSGRMIRFEVNLKIREILYRRIVFVSRSLFLLLFAPLILFFLYDPLVSGLKLLKNYKNG